MTHGLRLWQDIVGSAQFFKQISRREELVRHDIEVLTKLLAMPDFGRETPALRSLYGLDSELDALIDAGNSADLNELGAVLSRVFSNFRFLIDNKKASTQTQEPASMSFDNHIAGRDTGLGSGDAGSWGKTAS